MAKFYLFLMKSWCLILIYLIFLPFIDILLHIMERNQNRGVIMKKGYVYSIISALLFGICGVLVKLTQHTGLSSTDILVVQYTIAVIMMFFIAYIKDREKLKITKKKLLLNIK